MRLTDVVEEGDAEDGSDERAMGCISIAGNFEKARENDYKTPAEQMASTAYFRLF